MTHEVIVIGAGAAGEAATTAAAETGARVAVVERDLFGGLCSFWACMPSKTLLDAAFRRHVGAEYDWKRASERRDWMISREGTEYPDDRHHVKRLEATGAQLIRGEARVTAPGRVEVTAGGELPRTLEAPSLVVAIGSEPMVPPIEGLEEADFWRSPMATSTRELPASILIVGAGAVGVEMAQVFARFGVRTTLVHRGPRILAADHPRTSETLAEQLAEDGVKLRLGVNAIDVRSGGPGKITELSDGSVEESSEILVAIGRRPLDLRGLGIEEAGVVLSPHGGATHDDRMRIGDGVFIAGDAAGGPQFTHVADYEGRIAALAALRQRVRADLESVPKCLFTDPESAAVGLTVEEAQAKGLDVFEVTQDYAATARGQTIEGSRGHVTAVIDKERRILVGAFAACPGASELIHEAVLAIKQSIPIAVLADVIHAFPTGARAFGNLMLDAMKQLS